MQLSSMPWPRKDFSLISIARRHCKRGGPANSVYQNKRTWAWRRTRGSRRERGDGEGSSDVNGSLSGILSEEDRESELLPKDVGLCRLNIIKVLIYMMLFLSQSTR